MERQPADLGRCRMCELTGGTSARLTDAGKSFMMPRWSKMGANPLDLGPSVGTFVQEKPCTKHSGWFLSDVSCSQVHIQQMLRGIRGGDPGGTLGLGEKPLSSGSQLVRGGRLVIPMRNPDDTLWPGVARRCHKACSI